MFPITPAALPNVLPGPAGFETIPEAAAGFLVFFLLDFAFPMVMLLNEVKIEFLQCRNFAAKFLYESFEPFSRNIDWERNS